MLTAEGIYKDGKIELLETVSEVKQSKVLITFSKAAMLICEL